MEFKRVDVDPVNLASYSALFRDCFPGVTHLDVTYLRWLYYDNPVGQVLGFDAWDGAILAAHYVCVPADLLLEGEPVRGLLSLNTATRPQYQGRGLFTQLANRCYSAGAELGFSCVYGVANANSTPGFTRKLGFSLVAPLLAKIGIARPRLHLARLADQEPAFRRVWTTDSLVWRLRCPSNPVRLKEVPDGFRVLASARHFGIQAVGELPKDAIASESSTHVDAGFKLFLGLVPPGLMGLNGYVSIPERFRPSPLNLIYRNLRGDQGAPDADDVLLSFVDFDAY